MPPGESEMALVVFRFLSFEFHFEFHRAGKIGKRTLIAETGSEMVFDASG